MPPVDFTPSLPEKERVLLEFPALGRGLKEFTQYVFSSNFLTPVDSWSFTTASEAIGSELKDALIPGTEVTLTINDGVQSSGYIDSIETTASRTGGIEYHINGRDKLGQVVDSCADPTKSFKESQTLDDAMQSLFEPFGWTGDDAFIVDDSAGRNVKSGASRNKTRQADSKGFSRRAIKEYQLHQLRPYSREGVFAFASRICQRFGLWIWLTPSGNQVVVSQPNFEQDPIYQLRRNLDGTTNVLEGQVKIDISDQPSHIIADSYTRGGEFGKGQAKAFVENPSIQVHGGFDPAWLDAYKKAGAKELTLPPQDNPIIVPRGRPLFLHDDESQTQEQLENFIRRELALLQRKVFTASYVVEGHGQNTPDGFVHWTVDTVVRVDDDIANVHENLYIVGRTFHKSRGAGTTTHLDLIRLNTLYF